MLREFGEQIAALKLVPGDHGRFEVSINGELVFSKARSGRFPSTSEVRTVIQKRLSAAG